MLKPVFDFIGGALGVADITKIDGGYANFVTFLLATVAGTVAFLASYVRHRAEYRSENSDKFIASSKTEIINAMTALAPLVHRNKTVEEKRKFIQGNRKPYFTAVSHFEMVAVYMSIGYASEKIIRRVEAGNITRLFAAIAALVPEQRRNNRKVLLYYECMFIRFFFWRSILSFIIEIFMRDRLRASRKAFILYYRFYRFFFGWHMEYLKMDLYELRRDLRKFRYWRYALAIFAGLYALASYFDQ